jgi:heptosyltransferase II
MNLLVISPSWIGDVIIALPALAELKRRQQDKRLVVLAKPGVLRLWELSGLVDELVCQQDSVSATAAHLRALGAGPAYILPNSFRSALIAWLAGAHPRIGYAGHWRRALLSTVAEHRPTAGREHQVYEIMDLVGADADSEPEPPRIEIAADTRREVAARFGLPADCVGLIPGAARGPSKCWPEQHYAALGRMLAADGRRVALFGSPAERDLCGRIAAAIGDAALDFAGRSDVAEWAALLAGCAAVVANDSGGMHLAAAVGTPLVAVFGITDPGKTGPRGGHCRIIQRDVERHRDIARDSDLARKCLASISPESVYSALQELPRA